MKRRSAIFRILLALTCALQLLSFSALAQQPAAPTATEFSALKAEVEKLRPENKVLRQENERLQRLVKERDAAAAVAAPTITPRGTTLRAPARTSETLTHWMTISSGKRHNSSCRYYKNSNGRMCGPNEGVACKICGG